MISLAVGDYPLSELVIGFLVAGVLVGLLAALTKGRG